jgi:ubiquinone biosynthesis protein UbiJ
MTVAAKPLIAAVNHLLARENWARAKLLPYAGRRARVRMPVGTLEAVVLADGLLGPVLPAVAVDAGTGSGAGAGSGAGGTNAGTATDSRPQHAAPGFGTETQAASAAGSGPPPGAGSDPGPDAAAQRFDVTITVEAGAAPAFLSGGQAGAMKYVRIEGDAEFATALGYLAEHLRWEPEEDLAKLVGDAGAYRAAAFARDIAGRARRTGRNLLESIAEFLLDEDPQLVRRGELDTLAADLTRARDDVARLEKRIERLERAAPAAARAASAKLTPPDGTH